jgi:hypothetical protein
MTEEVFRAHRRQKFLSEKLYRLNLKWHRESLDEKSKIKKAGLTPNDVAYSPAFGSVFKEYLELLKLHYTAGDPIESLVPLYAETTRWFGAWNIAEGEYAQALSRRKSADLRLDMTPIRFGDLFHFQLALDVVSLGVLLGQGDLLRQAVAWMNSARGSDMLFEAIVEPAVPDPCDIEEFFHVEPYDPLLDAIYAADTPEQASAFIKTYLEGWYKAFEGVPWHNSHLIINEAFTAYDGYWAFEAAAVCVIHNIDDSSFRDHVVYPKDLADWARANNVLDKIKPDAGAHALRLRCEGGNPCPQAGYWFTPAKAGSRRRFSTGEPMPEIKDSPWGSTIWYWDEQR